MRIFIYIIPLLIFNSCRKDKNPAYLGDGSCSDFIYNQKTSNGFDFILDSLPSTSIFGQSEYRQEPILYKTPRFNPNNNYEICYIKDYNNGTSRELWKYDFCKNTKTLLASNVFYSLDWSVNNWIIYTGNDLNIYKIKSNGDSLIKLTTGVGFHNVGKWSPDGAKFWFDDAGPTITICSGTGSIISSFNPNADVVDWYDNNNLLVNYGGNFCKLNINTQIKTSSIHSSTVGIEMLSNFESKNKICLWQNVVTKKSVPQFLLKWDFINNQVDTIKQVYFSYKYLSADYNPKANKIILELYRAKWLNQVNDWIEYRQNIIIMNTDGTNERILNLN